MLLPRTAPPILRGFRDEFRIPAGLAHPGLARVFEFGELPDGRGYYTAEFVDGEALSEVAARGVRELCLAAAAVCRTLGYLHTRGYVHNDVTPANILVAGASESAKLLDFGLAGLDRASARTVAGTSGYIAPERLGGKQWDERADLYSLGATLYRVLAGRRVVEEEEPAGAMATLRRGWRPLHETRPDLPDGLTLLVERLLALSPAGRPRNAAEVIARLGDVIGETIPLETPGTARCFALASVLSGRDGELETIARALRGGTLVALGGAPGTGKSRLVREVSWRLEQQGWRVVSVSCPERGAPGDPIVRLLGQMGEGGAATGDLAADVAAERLASGRSPGSGTLIVIDDAHRAADFVWTSAIGACRLARASRDQGALAALCAFEEERLTTGARRWLELATAGGDAVRIDLGPLAGADIRRMAASLFGEGTLPDHLLAAIARRSGGNPLLVEEVVVDAVQEQGRVELAQHAVGRQGGAGGQRRVLVAQARLAVFASPVVFMEPSSP